MSKLSDFLNERQIDPRRVLVASKKLEALRPEDRAIKLARRQRKKEDNPGKQDDPGPKPRSGRPVAGPTFDNALQGKSISGAAKSRLLRAVNAVLKQKKLKEATLADLF